MSGVNRLRLQEVVWLLIVLLTPLFVNLWVEQQFEASKVWLLRVLIGVLALVCLESWLAGCRSRPPPTRICNLIIVLGLVLILSTLLSSQPYIATVGTLERANGVLTQISYLLLFICVAAYINSQRSRLLIQIIILTAVPICLLGLAQAIGWHPLPVITDARSAITTTLGRANFTGAYLALLLPLSLTAAQATTNSRQRCGYVALVIAQLIVILLTQARAAWIAAIVGVSVLLWLRAAPHWSRRMRWLSALGGMVIAGGLLLLILQHGLANGGSIAARWTIWQASLKLLWPGLWLGYGADTLELYFPSVYPPQLVYYQGRGIVVDRAHNWLLDWSLNYGLVATAILVWLISLILRTGWQRLVTDKNAEAISSGQQGWASTWVAACMAGICAQLVGNLFLFEVAATAVVFWLLLAIVTAAAPNDEAPTVRFALPLPVRLGVMGLCIVGFAGTVWQTSLRPLLADLHAWRGTQALSQGVPLAALADYSTAVNYQPRRAAYHVALALTAAQLGDLAQAEQAMLTAIALRPTDPRLYTHLAAIYARNDQSPSTIELAYQAYDQAIALAPTIALTYRRYADLALRLGDKAVALSLAHRAVDLDATDGIAFGILGWTHLQNGDSVAAQAAFEQAVKWTPNSADFHLGLATTYFQQGEFVAARQSLQRSLQLDPDYEPALVLQAQLQGR